MFELLLRKWKEGKITRGQLEFAVDEMWITRKQADIILATPVGAK